MKTLRALVAVGVVSGLLVWLWQGQHRVARSDATSDATSLPHATPMPSASPQDREASNARSAVASASGNQAAAVQAPTPAPAQIVSADDIKAMDPSLVALSPEEAAWLYKHGYPTQAELDALPTTSIDELWQRVRAGEQRAMTLLGLKYEQEGDLSQAASIQALAAQKGSLFAQEKMAELSLSEHNPTEDPTLFYLYMQIAKIFGDHRADAIIVSTLPSNMNASVRRQMELSALASLPVQLQLIAEDARLRGVPQPTPDPRPNADLWSQLDNGTLTQAPVYPVTPNPPGGP